MFRFGFPQFLDLLLMVPLGVLLLVYAFRQKRKMLSRFGDLGLLNKLSRTTSVKRRILKAALLISGMIVLVTALARPQFGNRVETVKVEGQDILVALDLSLSMLAQDIRPNRLEKAKQEVRSLIDLLQGDRIGLIGFAGEAFVQCPLTLDYGAARLFLSAMDPELIPVPGTALADAMEKAIQTFGKGDNKNKVLLVITDGEDHDGRVPEVAQKAAAEGIVIHTIGIGSPQGVPIPLEDVESGSGAFKKDRSGEVVLTRLDETSLRKIAQTTGGKYYRAGLSENGLDQIYKSIARMGTKEIATRQITLFDEKFQEVLALGLVLLVIELFIEESRRVPTEWKGRFQ